jgi:peptidyl-tRNA hydrolase, PTH1 family
VAWLVVGLGNPGPRYESTRHNIGFMIVDALARAEQVGWRERFEGSVSQVQVGTERVHLVKPQTFMNSSGRCARPLADFLKIQAEQTLVVHDELDVPFGAVRLKWGGGEGGHRGLRSISQEFRTQDYFRLRMGIGRPPGDFPGKPADFVLSAFAPAEVPALDEWIERGVSAVHLLVQSGPEAAMNEVNRRR